jgi:hypothetical protein
LKALLVLALTLCLSGCSGIVSVENRKGCYRSRPQGPFEVVKIVGVNPENHDEYMVLFIEQHGKNYERPLNVPKTKIDFLCNVNRDLFGARDGDTGATRSSGGADRH